MPYNPTICLFYNFSMHSIRKIPMLSYHMHDLSNCVQKWIWFGRWHHITVFYAFHVCFPLFFIGSSDFNRAVAETALIHLNIQLWCWKCENKTICAQSEEIWEEIEIKFTFRVIHEKNTRRIVSLKYIQPKDKQQILLWRLCIQFCIWCNCPLFCCSG